MPFGRNTDPQKRGRPISAAALRSAAENADAAQRLRAGNGLAQSSLAGLPLLRLALAQGLWHAVTTSVVAPRVGATIGNGTVKLLRDFRDNLVDAGLPDQKAYNYAGDTDTPPGIPSGTLVLVFRLLGKWKVISADCSGVAFTPATGPGAGDP